MNRIAIILFLIVTLPYQILRAASVVENAIDVGSKSWRI